MKDIRRVILARQSQRSGARFEQILVAQAYRTSWTVIDIPDGCKQLGTNKLIRVRSPFDYVFVKDKKAIFCDAKTTKVKSFKFSNITDHQAKLLKDIHKQGFMAGYIINFTELNQTVFFNGHQITAKGRGSLKPEDGVLIGQGFIINLDRIFTEIKEPVLGHSPA